MSNSARHIIHKLIVDVSTNSKTTGYSIKDDAAGFVSGRLAPELELLFEKLERRLDGRVLNLQHLSVDLNTGKSGWSSSDLERQVSEAVVRELEKQLYEEEAGLKERDRQLRSPSSGRLEAVFHFLRTGAKPWWITSNDQMNELFAEQSLLQLAAENPEKLLGEICRSGTGNVIRRMRMQLPENVLVEWLTAGFRLIAAGSREQEKKIAAIILQLDFLKAGKISAKLPESLLRLLAELGSFNGITALTLAELTGLLTEIPGFSDKIYGLAKAIENVSVSEKEPEKAAESDQKEIPFDLMENAGLILLHPFFKQFFTGTGLLENNKLTHPELAAHVLHFLATGEENAFEYELGFEKFICGISYSEPISREVMIPQEMKDEAISLLTAAVGHWKGLRSESYKLLQAEFLQREAKVIIDEFNSVRMVFERRTPDILLESLPWSLGVVKLDWFTDLIYVEW